MRSFEHVSAGYPGREVLHDVSFTAPKCRVTALVGPNGCGKTTLLLIACGLLRPGSGRVLLEGRPISSYSRRELARLISLLPQTREVPSVTVERLTAYGRYPHLGLGKVLSIQDRRLVGTGRSGSSPAASDSGLTSPWPSARTAERYSWTSPPPTWT